jgi:quercetin dioxygenase-like cupin family protein
MNGGRFALAGLLVLTLSSFGATAQTGGSQSPDSDVKEVLANGRVSVRDTTWRHGSPRPTNHFQDSVTVFLEGGRLRISKPSGASAVVTRQTGEVVADPKGDPDTREALDAPVRGIVIDLHDNVVPGLTNTSGYPEAFPRPGAKKVLETARVLVWDFTFAPSQSTPMHFHSRDVVTIYFDEGAVASTTPQGERTVNDHHPGEVRFNPRNRIHTEQLAGGKVHIVAVELK